MKSIKTYSNSEVSGEIILNANESYFSLDENIINQVVNIVKEVEFNRYPEDTSIELCKAYSKYAGVSAESIIAGNGSDEVIGLIISANIDLGKKLYTLSPDFSMYDYYTSLNGGEIIKYASREDGSFDINEFINYGKESNVDLIIFSNPNNPTGYALKSEDIIKILDAFKDKVVVIDEAYYEFNGESVISYISDYKNLLVTRTLSKGWGLAALRVGFLIGHNEIIEKYRGIKVPYNINTLSQAIATIVLDDISKVEKHLEEINNRREELYYSLKFLENKTEGLFKVYKSKSNFIFGRTNNKIKLLEELSNSGITIRSFKDNSFRITVGTNYENEKVIKVFQKVFTEGGFTSA